MISTDILVRSHFTRKVDGVAAFHHFLRRLNLQGLTLPFEFDGETMIKGKPMHFIAESWGGFENAAGEWTIFVSWRSANGNVTQYIFWTWDDTKQSCVGRRNYCFVG